MCSNKINWILILLFVNLLAIIKVIFQSNNYAVELGIIVGFILIAMFGIYGVFNEKKYGQGLLLFLFSAIILNQFYLYSKFGLDNYLIIAFVTSFLGLIYSFRITFKNCCARGRRDNKTKEFREFKKTIIENDSLPIKKVKKAKTTKKKKTAKKKVAKKKASKKKKTTKKKAKTATEILTEA